MLKRSSRTVALILALIGATTASAQLLALPPLPDEVSAQFPAIGRFGQAGFRTKQGCTATLIAPNIVVTAAHCVSRSGNSERVFVAGWSRGDYISASKTELEVRHPAFGLVAGPPSYDIAMVVLETPIEDVTPIPLGQVTTADLIDSEVALIGYHRRTPHILSGDFTCPVSSFETGLLLVGCPVVGGNSGSPILNLSEAGTWQVVGVISSQIGGAAIAVEIPDWLREEVRSYQPD